MSEKLTVFGEWSRNSRVRWLIAAETREQALGLLKHYRWWDRHVGILERWYVGTGLVEDHFGKMQRVGRFRPGLELTRHQISTILDEPDA